MLCKNCGKQIAKVYVKRSIEGKSRQVHIGWYCRHCGRIYTV